MPTSPSNHRIYNADDSTKLQQAIDEMPSDPRLSDASDWYQFALDILADAQSRMDAIEEELDAMTKERDELQAKVDAQDEE
jgi:hypothetical protein